MAPVPAPTKEEAIRAVDLLLAVVESDGDLFAALREIEVLHPRYNTFPGEVFMRLAATGLNEAGIDHNNHISSEHLMKTYVPECDFRGNSNAKMRFALLAGAATHGGVEVDLLDEAAYWRTDDFWRYAAIAGVAWFRAIVDQRRIPMSELCSRVRSREDDWLSDVV